MTLKTHLYVVVAGLTVLFARSAGANTVTSGQMDELKKARDEVAAKAAMAKGAAQQHFDLERRRLNQLIKELSQGQQAIPAQIQRAIHESRADP